MESMESHCTPSISKYIPIHLSFYCMEPTTTLLHLSAALPMPRLAVLRPPASSDVSAEVGNVSTVVLGNERPVVTNPAEQLGATIAYKVGQVELAIVVAVIIFTLIILIYNL